MQIRQLGVELSAASAIRGYRRTRVTRGAIVTAVTIHR
jgi:hypothetical protein